MWTFYHALRMSKLLILLFCAVSICSISGYADGRWQVLEPGLELGVFAPPGIPSSQESIYVLRIDPHRFAFRLLNASAPGQDQLLTAKAWCQHNGLVAAINASMYQKDYRSSVSLMQTRQHINNPRLSKDKAILAFDRRTPDVPLIKIIDRQCEPFADWRDKYDTFVQSIRMISCHGRNVWRPRPQKWSTAVIGIDRQGRGLFIHAREPYSPHDLINMLLALPLEIDRAMYAEGGREAQLYVHSGEYELELVGVYGVGFAENTGQQYVPPIPNVVGIARRAAPVK
jgi:uncharacterized protein YigE (DUF2233 family)